MSHEHPDPHLSRPARQAGRALRLGVGGPVGSGKTALVAALCLELRHEMALAVVTNDIYTTEDADFLRQAGVLADERIRAVRTGCCPHTAIRDDIAANLEAAEDLERERGDKVPRKGGPGVSLSDLLVINKTDLASHVGADLSVMERDAARVRSGRRVIFSSLRERPDAPEVSDWVRAEVRNRAAA